MSTEKTFAAFAQDVTFHSPKLGVKAIDVTSLYSNCDCFTFDPGLKNTSVCCSSICYIDGAAGTLLYRGYDIYDLTENCVFEEVAYLLFYAKIPNDTELQSFKSDVAKIQLRLAGTLIDRLASMPRSLHPMTLLIALVVQMEDCVGFEDDSEAALNLFALFPIAVAGIVRHVQGLKPIMPTQGLSASECFLEMLLSSKPSSEMVRIMDVLLTLHADHELNASTSNVRATTSTGSSVCACIAAGLASLWGPLHGGANEACMKMLESIENSENIPKALARAKDKTDDFRLMGFGHRVYKHYDPRAKIVRKMVRSYLKKHASKSQQSVLRLALELEDKALEDPYFIDHKLYPNVDYYSGIMQTAIGIPTQGFTSVFALARCAGWLAHWLESRAQQDPLVRPRQLYQGSCQRTLPDKL